MCVILVTFITTNLVTLVAIVVWRIHPAIVFVIWLPFACLDALYLTSALTKVPDGAWFTLLLAFLLASFFSLWRYGKEKQWLSEARSRQELSDLIVKAPDSSSGQQLAERYGGGELTRIDGMGIFFDKAGAYVPTVYEQWIRKFHAQMDIVVLMHLRALSVPHVDESERFAVSRTSTKDVYRMTIRHGYNDHIISPDLGRLVYLEIRKAIVSGAIKPSPSERLSAEGVPQIDDVAHAAKLRHLDEAYETQALYLVGKQQMRINGDYNFVKRILLGTFLWVRENCRSRVATLNLPLANLVEVGFVGEI